MDEVTTSWITRAWREWLRSALFIVVAVTAFRSAIADWNDVPTGSMKPTILEGDRIVVNKLAYDLRVPYTRWHLARWADPERGDIVVLSSPADDRRLVKRVIGLPGDTIAMVDNRLVVNGRPVATAPLDGELAAVVEPQGCDRVVAAERLGGHDHAMMITPGAPTLRSFGPIALPEGAYFIMGDNRDESYDSRHFGLVGRDRIIGRALAVAGSVDPDNHFWPRWKRFFTGLK
ncbi:MAG: signal peptidase I [Thermoanaerobaculales bacterium]|jgi:signal peptidase I|nr:signal peptidase I [Thermoanaerobaculales bacterium]